MNNKGFTLVEVLAVIAIIAIVGTITVPSVLSMMNASKNNSYEIMIDNIRIAAETMYQEIENFGTITGDFKKIDSIKNYKAICTDEGDDVCKTHEAVQINVGGQMNVNLQTLVGNGFLNGVSNNDLDNLLMKNKNKKLIKEPRNNEDIGACKIIVTKVKKANDKVCYKIVADNDKDGIINDKCPSDYGNVEGCS